MCYNKGLTSSDAISLKRILLQDGVAAVIFQRRRRRNCRS